MTGYRIGQGYDVHKLVSGRKLILGGVEVAFGLGLEGHSDADVLAHAVIDALLGAAALGNIGKLFPDTDPQFKDADSMLLLEEAGKQLIKNGYTIVNIDSTIVAQKPRLAEYLDAMSESMAFRLGLEPGQVSVKAKTEEGLGFTGTMQGMAAHAVCLIGKV